MPTSLPNAKNKIIAAAIFGSTDNAYFMQMSLNQRNVPIVVFDSSVRNEFRHALFMKSPNLSEPDKLIEYLNSDNIINLFDGFVVIPSSDEYARFFSCYRNALNSKYRFHLPSCELVDSCANKIKFSMLCKDLDIFSPKSYIFESESLYKLRDEDISYPIILKPSTAREIPKSIINKVKYINSAEEFESVARKIWKIGASVFCQEYIPGGNKQIYFVGGYINENSEPEKIFIGKKHMEYPLLGGTTTLCELEWDAEIYSIFCKFVKKTKYCGLIDMEFKKNNFTNKPIILEVNPRIGQWHPISNDGNMDIVSYYVGSLLDKSAMRLGNEYHAHTESRSWLYCHYHLIALVEKHGLIKGIFHWVSAIISNLKISDVDFLNYKRAIRLVRVVLGRFKQLGYQLFIPKNNKIIE